jgi:hypothetical protein
VCVLEFTKSLNWFVNREEERGAVHEWELQVEPGEGSLRIHACTSAS